MINTGGFGVDVMPRYTPVDPTMVALNPANVTKGLQDAFSVATDAEKLKALKALNDEVAQLREDRVNAHRLGYQQAAADSLKRIQLAPLETTAETGKLTGQIKLQPGDLSNALTRQQIESGQLGFDSRMQPTVLNTKEQQIVTDNALQGDKSVADLNNAAVVANQSSTNLDLQSTREEIAAMQAAADLQAAQLRYKNDPSNAQYAQDLMKARATLANASAAHANAAAALADAKAKNGGRAAMTPAQMEEQIRRQGRDLTGYIKSLNSEAVAYDEASQRPISLGTYLVMSRNNDGSVKDGYKPGEDSYNAKAEALAGEVTRAEGQLRAMHATAPASSYVPKAITYPGAAVTAPISTNATPVDSVGSEQPDTNSTPDETASPAIDVSYLTPEQQDAYFWATDPANSDDPRSAEILSRLPIK